MCGLKDFSHNNNLQFDSQTHLYFHCILAVLYMIEMYILDQHFCRNICYFLFDLYLVHTFIRKQDIIKYRYVIIDMLVYKRSKHTSV